MEISWLKQSFECQLVQRRKISQGLTLFKISLLATLKASAGQIQPAGCTFDFSDLGGYNTHVLEISLNMSYKLLCQKPAYSERGDDMTISLDME